MRRKRECKEKQRERERERETKRERKKEIMNFIRKRNGSSIHRNDDEQHSARNGTN